MGRFSFFLLLSFIAVVHPAISFVMIRDGLPVCFIVLGKDAVPAEEYAARELTNHLKLMTGAGIPVRIMNYNDIPETGRAVLIGQGDWLKMPRFSNSREEMEILGDQGLVIRSYHEDEPEILMLCGKSPRGTLYAVYELLRKIGVRWYTKDVTGYPSYKTIDLGEMEVSDLPCFDLRDVSINNADISPEWRLRLRLSAGNGFKEQELAIPPVYYPLKVNCEDIIPSSGFHEQPDLFPLINGRHTSESAARCFSNPQCAAVAADSIRAYLSRNPDVTAVTINFPGYSGGCQCAECELRRKTEKGESGLVLFWLNRIAERLKREFPDVLIELTASGQLESPPATVKPAASIVIRLCPDDADQLHFYEESIDERTMVFMEHLRGWKRLNTRIFVSHPCGHAEYPAVSFPDFRQIFKNIEMYHYSFVEGCFLQYASMPGIYVADDELRMWIFSELMWDRYQDGDALVREWMKGVYGNAWGPMMDYWKHVQKIAQVPNIRATEHTAPFDYFPRDWFITAERMYQRAFALSLTDSTAHRYVMKTRLGFQYMQLLNVMTSSNNKSQLNKTEKEKYLNLLKLWVNEFREFGYVRVSKTQTFEEFGAEFREKIGKK